MILTRTLLATLLLCCFFSACKKDELPDSSGNKRLQRIIYGDEDSIGYTSFFYDTLNRLIAIKDSNNNGHLAETSIEYNNQVNPVLFTTYYPYNPGVPYYAYDSLVYENNRIVKLFSKVSGSTYYGGTTLNKYDAQGRLIGFAGNSYTYDINDNIVEGQELHWASDSLRNYGKTEFLYDTRQNVYSNLGLTGYFVGYSVNGGGEPPIGIPLVASKNNVTQWSGFDGYGKQYTYTYTYEYGNGGNVNKVVLHLNYDGRTISRKIDFFYE